MSFALPYKAADGNHVMLPSETIELLNRIQKGDPTCGWGGDPQMFTTYDNRLRRYELWREDNDGKSYILNTWAPEEFDTRVLVWLVEHDAWNQDIQKRIDDHNESIQRDFKREHDALTEETADFIEYGMRKLYMPGFEAPRANNMPRRA